MPFYIGNMHSVVQSVWKVEMGVSSVCNRVSVLEFEYWILEVMHRFLAMRKLNFTFQGEIILSSITLTGAIVLWAGVNILTMEKGLLLPVAASC